MTAKSAFLISIAIQAIRNTVRKLSRKLVSPAPNRPGQKDVVNVVLLRPTPPGVLPVAACDGYPAARAVANLLNNADIRGCAFNPAYPDYPYLDIAAHLVRQNRLCPLYHNISQLPRHTQMAIYDAFAVIRPEDIP